MSKQQRVAWRKQQLREGSETFHADVAQGPLEGFSLVRPDGSLTAEVVNVQWMDNHPDGPDSHVMISFADYSNVEFVFDTPVIKARPNLARAAGSEELQSAAPSVWGRASAPWA
jgi:hypothetical protein